MTRGMTAFPAGLMVLFIAVLVFLQLLPPASSLNDTHDNYSCVPSSCGNISNISYPFRLKGDPPKCGDTRYELSCDENSHTLLSFNGSRYYVSQINYNNYTIRIVDAGIQEDNYSLTPRYFLNHRYFLNYFGIRDYVEYSTYVHASSTGDYVEYSYSTSVRRQIFEKELSRVVVIVNCEKPVAPSSSFYLVSISTNCSNINNGSGSASNSSLSQYSKRYLYLFVEKYYQNISVMDMEESCMIEQMSLISWPEQINGDSNISYTDLRNVFSSGFELSWFYPIYCGNCSGFCYLGDDNQAHCNPWSGRFTFATFLQYLSYVRIVVRLAYFTGSWAIGRFKLIGRESIFFVVMEVIIGFLLGEDRGAGDCGFCRERCKVQGKFQVTKGYGSYGPKKALYIMWVKTPF